MQSAAQYTGIFGQCYHFAPGVDMVGSMMVCSTHKSVHILCTISGYCYGLKQVKLPFGFFDGLNQQFKLFIRWQRLYFQRALHKTKTSIYQIQETFKTKSRSHSSQSLLKVVVGFPASIL
jgi:hypothetical protein